LVSRPSKGSFGGSVFGREWCSTFAPESVGGPLQRAKRIVAGPARGHHVIGRQHHCRYDSMEMAHQRTPRTGSTNENSSSYQHQQKEPTTLAAKMYAIIRPPMAVSAGLTLTVKQQRPFRGRGLCTLHQSHRPGTPQTHNVPLLRRAESVNNNDDTLFEQYVRCRLDAKCWNGTPTLQCRVHEQSSENDLFWTPLDHGADRMTRRPTESIRFGTTARKNYCTMTIVPRKRSTTRIL
jgi:hypothetical protein